MNNNIFILIKIVCPDYNSRCYTAYIYTGENINICKRRCFTNTCWKNLPNPIIIQGFNQSGNLIHEKSTDVKIHICNRELIIKEIFPCDGI